MGTDMTGRDGGRGGAVVWGRSRSGGQSGAVFGNGVWLVKLRWVAAAGQLATLSALSFIGGSGVQVGWILGIEGVMLASNLVMYGCRRSWAMRGRKLVGPTLILDTVLLTALLGFSGGPMNPYTIFYLVHVVMAAVLLGGMWTWVVAGVCTAGYGVLFVAAPVSPHVMHGDAFASHLYGMMSSFVIASVCTAYFVMQVQREKLGAEAALREAREGMQKAEAFAALTAVAAGAAHELATPLGTIAVAAVEMERAARRLGGRGEELAGDARLIREEVDRCQRILNALSPTMGAGDELVAMSPGELVEAVLSRLGENGRERVRVAGGRGGPIPIPRNRTAQAAAALVQNALDAGEAWVTVGCDTAEEGLTLSVQDDGRGMAAAVQARLGEPFFTTKRAGRGLGLFLVRQFVEQAGGRLVIESAEGQGTRVTMVVPRAEVRGWK